MYYLLHSAEMANDVVIHTDMLCQRPTALSRKRAAKISPPKQDPNPDMRREECLGCFPDKLAKVRPVRYLAENTVVAVLNAAPYLPYDQRVLFLYNDKEDVRTERLHAHQIQQIRPEDLYYPLKAGIELGTQFAKQPLHAINPHRMVYGINIGPLAGQSQPHIHSQYAWELLVPDTAHCTITRNMLNLYYEELGKAELILYSDDDIKIIAPWTPKGQYHVELHFQNKYEIRHLDEKDLNIFAYFGWRLLQYYANNRKIFNVNIDLSSSPLHTQNEPVIVKFVPRVNMPAFYELHGVDVVDTPPLDIAVALRNEFIFANEVAAARNYVPQQLESLLLEPPIQKQ
ncbi:hypothetical protein HY486_01595 [Candidatus Woesearchaeota archaeon]|nr:hypothetical protein [Candidatus Woesearchaeota archaeon]